MKTIIDLEVQSTYDTVSVTQFPKQDGVHTYKFFVNGQISDLPSLTLEEILTIMYMIMAEEDERNEQEGGIRSGNGWTVSYKDTCPVHDGDWEPSFYAPLRK